MLEEGRLYKVDTRLRPSGEQGLLVTSWGSFERYHRDEAAGWERVALLRARVVFSNEDAPLRARREAELAAIAFDRPFDPKKFIADLRGVRARVETERGACPPGRATSASIRAASWTWSSWSRSASCCTRPIPASASPRRVRRSRAWSPSAGRNRCPTTTRRCGARRSGFACCSIARGRVSPRDLPMLARSLGTSGTLSAPISTNGWRACGRCRRALR